MLPCRAILRGGPLRHRGVVRLLQPLIRILDAHTVILSPDWLARGRDASSLEKLRKKSGPGQQADGRMVKAMVVHDEVMTSRCAHASAQLPRGNLCKSL